MTDGETTLSDNQNVDTTASHGSGWSPPANTMLTLILVSVLALAGAFAILAAWNLPPFETDIVSTENAYVRGRTTIISPQVSGYISTIPVHDYQRVRPGEKLITIDASVYRQKVLEAQANLDNANASLSNNSQLVAQRRADITTAEAKMDSAKAQLGKAAADEERVDLLVKQGSASVSDSDTSRATWLSALALVKEAEAGLESANQALLSAEVNATVLKTVTDSVRAQLELAKIDLGYTTISAPEAGNLSDVGARVGQYVTGGTQLVFLVPDARWVTANFKEAQTANIKPGQRAWFKVDALSGEHFSGIVESLAPAAGSEFSVLRTDNAIGNFTKIPQRIAVRIAIDPDQSLADRLRPGMSVEAYVDTAPEAPLHQ